MWILVYISKNFRLFKDGHYSQNHFINTGMINIINFSENLVFDSTNFELIQNIAVRKIQKKVVILENQKKSIDFYENL